MWVFPQYVRGDESLIRSLRPGCIAALIGEFVSTVRSLCGLREFSIWKGSGPNLSERLRNPADGNNNIRRPHTSFFHVSFHFERQEASLPFSPSKLSRCCHWVSRSRVVHGSYFTTLTGTQFGPCYLERTLAVASAAVPSAPVLPMAFYGFSPIPTGRRRPVIADLAL